MKDMLGIEIKVGDYIGLVVGRGSLAVREVIEVNREKVKVRGPKITGLSSETRPAWITGYDKSRYSGKGVRGEFTHTSTIVLNKREVERLIEDSK